MGWLFSKHERGMGFPHERGCLYSLLFASFFNKPLHLT